MAWYLASPAGFTEAGRLHHTRVLLPALATVVQVTDPWTLTTAGEFARARDRGELPRFVIEVGRRNAEAIRRSQGLIACLDGQEVDSGTAAEVGFAAALGLPCLGLRTDLRQAGEEGAQVNLQVQALIELSGGRIHTALDGLIGDLRSRHATGPPSTEIDRT